MTTPINPATIPSNVPTQSTPAPSIIPAQPIESPNIQAQPQTDSLTLQELTYVMAAYYYYHASILSHTALEELNTAFINIDTLANPELLRKMEAGEQAVEKSENLEKEGLDLNSNDDTSIGEYSDANEGNY